MWETIHRKMKCSYQSKLLFYFAADVVFLISGICSLAVGIWLYLEKNDFIELTPSSYSALSAAGLCCFTGATVCIISLVGFAGAWLENKCLLLTFMGFVVLLGIIQTMTGLTGMFYKSEAKEHVRLDLLHNVNRSHVMTTRGHAIELRITWDHMQETLQCCGVDAPSDWFYSYQWPNNEFVPDSCCNPNAFIDDSGMTNCGKVPMNSEHWFQQGCYPVFIDWLFHHIWVVNYVSISLLLVETVVFVSVILVIHALSELKKKRKGRDSAAYHRRLREANERERRELRMEPLDRMGDANMDAIDGNS